MKYAWVENQVIREVAQGDPAETYHPDIAAHFTAQVPDNAAAGDGWVNGGLIKPVVVPPPAPTPAPPPEPPVYAWFIDTEDFFERFPNQKRRALFKSADLDVKAILQEIQAWRFVKLQRPRTVNLVNELVALLIITAGEATAILTTPVAAAEQAALVKAYF